MLTALVSALLLSYLDSLRYDSYSLLAHSRVICPLERLVFISSGVLCPFLKVSGWHMLPYYPEPSGLTVRVSLELAESGLWAWLTVGEFFLCLY